MVSKISTVIERRFTTDQQNLMPLKRVILVGSTSNVNMVSKIPSSFVDGLTLSRGIETIV